jgi:translation initiation factor RLI1
VSLKQLKCGEKNQEKRLMPGKMALVNYNKCRPEKCDSGTCAAALACSHKLLKQEAPYEIPMTDPSVCQGCGDCVRACPLKAIKIVRM